MKRTGILLFLIFTIVALVSCHTGVDWFSDGSIYRKIQPKQYVSKQMRSCSVKISDNTVAAEGVSFNIETSAPEYKIGQVMQLRLTVSNTSDKRLYFAKKNRTIRFLRDDGECLMFEIVKLDEWAEDSASDVPVCMLEPGEAYTYERAVVLTSSFFGSARNCELAFDFEMFLDPTLLTADLQHHVKLAASVSK